MHELGNYSSRSCDQECGGRTMTTTMFKHRNHSQARVRSHELQSKHNLGASAQNSEGFGKLWTQQETAATLERAMTELHIHTCSWNSAPPWEREPQTPNPPQNSPHGGYTVDELFRLVWQPWWKNYFNWLQAQNPTLQLQAWSTVPKTVKNYLSCSWLDRLPNKNIYTYIQWTFTFSGTASVAQTANQKENLRCKIIPHPYTQWKQQIKKPESAFFF